MADKTKKASSNTKKKIRKAMESISSTSKGKRSTLLKTARADKLGVVQKDDMMVVDKSRVEPSSKRHGACALKTKLMCVIVTSLFSVAKSLTDAPRV